ncbi:MAG: serine/threonine-protein kinase [Actinomycetes bacterium]
MTEAGPVPAPSPLRRGDPEWLGPFRLLGRLGVGGMGIVFVGEDAWGRRAAVKLPHEAYAADPVFRARFTREVAAAQKVSGRFTASVLGASVVGDRPWLATELVQAPSLGALVEGGGPLDHSAQRALAAGLAEALVAIHEAGLVHRDVKPNNVLCAPDGPRVIDFGIAVAPDSSRLTAVGMVLGSPVWMSPEHLRGEQAGPAADVFGWGLLLAYVANGRSAFGEGDAGEMLQRILYGVPDLGRPSALAPDLRRLVVAALSRDPLSRPTAAALCASLAHVPEGDASLAAAGVRDLVDRTWTVPSSRPDDEDVHDLLVDPEVPAGPAGVFAGRSAPLAYPRMSGPRQETSEGEVPSFFDPARRVPSPTPRARPRVPSGRALGGRRTRRRSGRTVESTSLVAALVLALLVLVVALVST